MGEGAATLTADASHSSFRASSVQTESFERIKMLDKQKLEPFGRLRLR
jgi:hypothetical protein